MSAPKKPAPKPAAKPKPVKVASGGGPKRPVKRG